MCDALDVFNIMVTTALTGATFAPYGDVLDASGQPDMLINGDACQRFDDRARLSVDAGGRLGISIFSSRCYALPVSIAMMERHPLASQAFIPLSGDPFLVVVAPDEAGVPGTPVAFVTSGGQGVNILANTWHGVLTPLGASGLFAVIDRVGPGDNCDVYTFVEPYIVQPTV